MNHGAHCRLVDAEPESDSAHEDANLVRHPALLIFPSRIAIHFAVIGDGWNSVLLEEVDRFFHFVYRWRVDDHVRVPIFTQRFRQKARLLHTIALFDDVAEIWLG